MVSFGDLGRVWDWTRPYQAAVAAVRIVEGFVKVEPIDLHVLGVHVDVSVESLVSVSREGSVNRA